MTTITLPRPTTGRAAATATAPTTPASVSVFRGLAYDAFDAQAAAEFWAAALRVEVAPGASRQFAQLVDDPASGMPRLVFRQATEGRVLSSPLHLQLTTNDLDHEMRRLQGLGARRLGSLSAEGRRWVTLADPEGNEFDLVAA